MNLSVALFLKANLESQGMEVIMTRDTDKALYSSESSTNKKKEDLAKRIEIITETNPDFVLCIHQNILRMRNTAAPRSFIIRNRRKAHDWPHACRPS